MKFQIPDDSDASYKNYADSVKHIACDRKDIDAVKDKVSGGGFDGRPGHTFTGYSYFRFRCCVQYSRHSFQSHVIF